MRALVVGGSGVLGRRVVGELTRRHHPMTVMSRGVAHHGDDDRFQVVMGDLENDPPLEVDDVDVIFHCATDRRRHRRVDVAGTARLLAMASERGAHLVYPGVVGSDLVPRPYYRSKTAAEHLIEESPGRWTIVRATQFHDTVWALLARLSRYPVMPVPHDTRAQPLDPETVAAVMVDAAEAGTVGRLADLGGAFAYEFADLARSYLAATHRRRKVIALNVPGIAGAAWRAGANLTPNRDEDGRTWNDFVAGRITR